MRLRQMWKDNKLVGLRLDKSSQEFIPLNQMIVDALIEHVNERIENEVQQKF